MDQVWAAIEEYLTARRHLEVDPHGEHAQRRMAETKAAVEQALTAFIDARVMTALNIQPGYTVVLTQIDQQR